MNTWQRWLRRPQNEWLRKAFFQVHLWSGIALGLYVLVISVSGSAIVFRNEIYGAADTGPREVAVAGEPLTEDALKAAIASVYPDHSVRFIWPGKEVNHATEIWMDRDGARKQRLFDPYTGQDLGPSIPMSIQVTAWFMNLHTDLLAGDTGRQVNGVASILFTLLAVTGLVVWWPGVDKWRRSLWVNPRSGWKRINWDLHSAVGFWTFALVFMWGVTGVFLVWPLPFQRVVNHFSPLIQYQIDEPEEEFEFDPEALLAPLRSGLNAQPAVESAPVLEQEDLAIEGSATDAGVTREESVVESNVDGGDGYGKGKGRRREIPRSAGDIFLRWWYYLHFGNFMGWKVKALWVALGLLPALLFVTGTIMWWNRILSPSARRSRRKRAPEPVAGF